MDLVGIDFADPIIIGFLSKIWKGIKKVGSKVWKGAKKVLPYAAPLLIPGVGGALSGAFGKIGGAIKAGAGWLGSKVGLPAIMGGAGGAGGAGAAAGGGSFLGNLAKGAVGQFVGAGVSHAANRMFAPSPASLGRDAAEFRNAAFPGTNPWEQLGSSQGAPSGALEGEEIRARTALGVAKIGAEAQKYGADKRFEETLVRENTGQSAQSRIALQGAQAREVERAILLMDSKERLNMESALNQYMQASKTENQANIEFHRSMIAKELAKADLSFQSTRTFLQTLEQSPDALLNFVRTLMGGQQGQSELEGKLRLIRNQGATK